MKAKMSSISSIFIKTFWIFFWWKILQIVFFFFFSLAFESIFFCLGCDDWKMDNLFQRPLGPTFSILNFPKNFWWKLKSNSFHQKKIEKFWWKLKEYKPYPYSAGTFGPLGLKVSNISREAIDYAWQFQWYVRNNCAFDGCV